MGSVVPVFFPSSSRDVGSGMIGPSTICPCKAVVSESFYTRVILTGSFDVYL